MKKIAKRLLIAGIICVLLLLAAIIAVFFINRHVVRTAEPYLYAPEDADGLQADCILILGAGLKPDGTPNLMLRDRLDCGIELYRQGISDKILVSGDHGRKNYDEVNAMKTYLTEHGIPAENVFLDHAGFSTYESMYRAKAIFCLEKPVIVTQKYHLYRAVYSARNLGLDAYGVNSDPFVYPYQYMRDLREVAARCKDFFYGIFRPQPTYLGDTIPVSTSTADMTDG